MLEKHTTKDHETMLIAEMTDEHLTNMIQLIIKDLILPAKSIQEDEYDDFQRALYNLPKVDRRDAGKAVRKAIQKLYPYLSEAYLRGLEGPRLALIDALGRDAALPRITQGLLLGDGDTVDLIDLFSYVTRPGNDDIPF